MYRYLQMHDGLVIETKNKDWTNLTIKMWYQKFIKMASFGLGILQRLLTISWLCYFLRNQGQM